MWCKNTLNNLFASFKKFFERQTENFRALLTISVLHTTSRELTAGIGAIAGGGHGAGGSYLQLYIRALGANAQQIGLVNSITQVGRSIFALPLGWISDRFSLKKIVVAGLILSVIVPVAFILATDWVQAIPAMITSTVSQVLTGMFVNVFFISSIAIAADRAFAMSMKSTLIAISALAIPTISAMIVLNFGGINVDGIRPLFLVQAIAGIFILVYTYLKLKEVSHLQKKGTEHKRSILQDYKEIAKISSVQKWTAFKGLRTFFSQMLAFYSIYYVEIKGADPIILAAMGTVGVVISLIILLPFGRLADKYGRKRILYVTRPFNYISILMIILAPSPQYLILASIVGSLQSVSQLMEITMEHELVPAEQRGRWGGFLFFFMGLVGIPGPIFIGYLWNLFLGMGVNPGYLFLLQIVTDLPFVAVISTIPDTLYETYQKSSQ